MDVPLKVGDTVHHGANSAPGKVLRIDHPDFKTQNVLVDWGKNTMRHMAIALRRCEGEHCVNCDLKEQA